MAVWLYEIDVSFSAKMHCRDMVSTSYEQRVRCSSIHVDDTSAACHHSRGTKNNDQLGKTFRPRPAIILSEKS